MKNLIQRLVETTGPSGYEHDVRSLVRGEIESHADEIHVDPMGNLIARKGSATTKSATRGKRIMISAHMDEIGIIATHVDKDGFVRFTNLGGVYPKNCVGGRVRYTTGNPMTPVAGAFQEDDGDWVPVDGAILSERLPDFFQLDVRVDRSWRRPWGTLNLYIDLQNVVNRANAEGVTYNEDFSRKSYTTGLPIFPSIGVEYLP